MARYHQQPHEMDGTWSSAKVTKAKARNGLGMKTSVTSPYCMKNWRNSSVVMSSVQRPTNTFLHLMGSSGPCCFGGGGGKGDTLDGKSTVCIFAQTVCFTIQVFYYSTVCVIYIYIKIYASHVQQSLSLHNSTCERFTM